MILKSTREKTTKGGWVVGQKTQNKTNTAISSEDSQPAEHYSSPIFQIRKILINPFSVQ